ncbi:hepatitis A virus cellular receptor 2 homolog isoform X2 [Pelmatolapia mariae]|uniref:hepatitis A virus cellular receptor 2 homolog isoform X2 n=1 Tax=Pelmatolapia mariae TaxID=158779 RepID=UPI002FE59F6A
MEMIINAEAVNRVSLQETLMKDGDVSLILNNVSTAESGTYECRVYMKGTGSWKSISINLSVVDPPGQTGGDTEDRGKEDGGKKDGGKKDGGKEDGGKEDGSVGLKVGLPVGLIVAAVVGGGVFLIYRKLKAQKQGSYQVPAEQQPV